MTQIFLIRHGEAEGNLYRRVQGQSDSPLTSRGRAQLPYLTARFADIPLAAVYSSDLSRARDTARAAAGERDIPLFEDPRLREMCFGVWENMAWGNVDREYPEMKRYFLTDPDKFLVPEAETFLQVRHRATAAMVDIARRHEGGTVAVACHGMEIRTFLAWVQGVKSADISTVVLPGNTAVAELSYEDGRFTLLYGNDSSHLPEPPYIPFREGGSAPGMSWDLRYTPFDRRRDKALFLDCYREAWTGAHGSLKGFDAESCWQGTLLRAKDSPEALQTVWLGDKVAGFLALDERRGAHHGHGWIAFCCILPEYRGHRCGLQLIGAAMARYRALGRRSLRLSVAPHNPAVDFYKHLGFVTVGTEEGALQPLYIMERPL